MKCKKLIIETILLLGILTTSMPSSVFSKTRTDTLVLSRTFSYQRNFASEIRDIEDNVYMKFRYHVDKRNPTLWLIPSMDVLARGKRDFIAESYNKVYFEDLHHYKIETQAQSSTIPHNRKTMRTMLDFFTPNLYSVALYNGHVLSPFNKTNSRYYSFSQNHLGNGETRLNFRPKVFNTQLVNGYAILDSVTGRIIRTVISGEYDMISFRTEIVQGDAGARALLPKHCTTAAYFGFAGNRLEILFEAMYDCKLSLPESMHGAKRRSLMDSIRPLPLTLADEEIYRKHEHKQPEYQQETEVPASDTSTAEDSTRQKKPNLFKKIFFDTIGDNLVTPIKAEAGNASFRLSPIINPLYLSYSHNHGLSYKMKLRARYTFSRHRYLTFNPSLGYNFKISQFYYTLPLRMTYNPKRNGYAKIQLGNGNRIGNNSVINEINRLNQDTIDFRNTNMNRFDDKYLSVVNNIMVFRWLDVEAGAVYHRRRAVNRKMMRQYSMPEKYRSFAPLINFKIRPWRKGPLFTIEWERGLEGIRQSNMRYERWEFDGSWKRQLNRLRVLNLRLGSGFYSQKTQRYFVDYTNFRDNNLPEGWNDEWTGSFQLLKSRWYNEADYYIRANASYESPLLLATWLPFVGKFIEKERLYFNSAFIQNKHPYYELAYGFTTRYASVIAYASFMSRQFNDAGCKLEFELFRKW